MSGYTTKVEWWVQWGTSDFWNSQRFAGAGLKEIGPFNSKDDALAALDREFGDPGKMWEPKLIRRERFVQ